MDFPESLKYTKDHEWIDTAGKPARVGVTEFAIDQLGDIVHIELPEVGESFESGSSFGTIESTKTVSDLYLPVAGTVTEVNNDIVSSPESLATDPYKGGWLIKLSISGGTETLMSHSQYENFVSEQEA